VKSSVLRFWPGEDKCHPGPRISKQSPVLTQYRKRNRENIGIYPPSCGEPLQPCLTYRLRHIITTGRCEYGPSAVLRGLWGHTHPGVVANGHTISHGRCAVFGGGRIGHTELQAQTHRPTKNRCLGMCQKPGWRTIQDRGIRYVSITY
jgi:hypothetical protein